MRLRGSGQGRAGGPKIPENLGVQRKLRGGRRPLQGKGCSGSLSAGSRREGTMAPTDPKWVPWSRDTLGFSSSS